LTSSLQKLLKTKTEAIARIAVDGLYRGLTDDPVASSYLLTSFNSNVAD
jgi:hypothetical protein